MRETYFSTESLSVGYDKKALIHDITLDIKKGEVVALIGPNGAGKSTILKTITRQLARISGAAYIDKMDVSSAPLKELSQKMAVVLTERLKPELMTCRDIVAMGRYPYTGRLGVLSESDEEKVNHAIETVHAEDFAGRDFNAISDGQKQRILLARAICQEPELIVLDEPTSFLDIRHKLELLSILRSMAKEKDITVIMSLHEIDLVQKIADKVVCVKGDHIFRYGRPGDIFKDELIKELYDIDNGFYDSLFGSIELPKPEGEPKVLVISSGGAGIPVYRELQKENTPFAAAILYTNDKDYQLARLLAAEVVTEQPFESISDEAFARAKALMEQCGRVIVAPGTIVGSCNRRLGELIRLAEEKPVKPEQ